MVADQKKAARVFAAKDSACVATDKMASQKAQGQIARVAANKKAACAAEDGACTATNNKAVQKA